MCELRASFLIYFYCPFGGLIASYPKSVFILYDVKSTEKDVFAYYLFIKYFMYLIFNVLNYIISKLTSKNEMFTNPKRFNGYNLSYNMNLCKIVLKN